MAASQPGSPAKKTGSNKRLRLLYLALLVLIMGMGAWYYVTLRPTATKEETHAAVAAADEAMADHDKAIGILLTAYNGATDQEAKADAAYYLAGRFSAKEDHKNALRYYQEAYKLGMQENIDVILGVAKEADATGNKKLASEYYQKAIDYYEPLVEGDSSLRDLLDRFKSRIEELK